MTITDNFREITYAQDSKESVITLLEIGSDDETAEKMYVCDVPVEKFADMGENMYGVTSNGQRYIFLPFEFTLPQDDKTGAVMAKLSIQNIDRSIVPYIRTVKNKIKINTKIVLSSTPDVSEIEYKDFTLSNVEYNLFSISGTLTYSYDEQEPFPSGRFNPSNFPGLF